MRLREPIERHGVFWLPEDESEQVQGVLRIETTGSAVLTVRYAFDAERGAATPRPPWHDVWTNRPSPPIRIVGQVGFPYATLEGCVLAGGTPGLAPGALSKARFRIRRVFLGAAYERDEDITFSRLTFSADGLTSWIAPEPGARRLPRHFREA